MGRRNAAPREVNTNTLAEDPFREAPTRSRGSGKARGSPGIREKGGSVGLGKSGLALSVLMASAGLSHAVTLGGTNVPKEKFVVYLMIGHSNMAGQDLAHSDGTSDPHGWFWPVSA